MKTKFLNEQMMVLNRVIVDYDKDSQTPLLSSLEVLQNILKKNETLLMLMFIPFISCCPQDKDTALTSSEF